MKVYTYLIVGAGLTGATVARALTDAGATCLVIEQREHIGGNCYDQIIEGVPVGMYGGHIFHTNSKRIWKWAKRFGKFIQYEHRVKVEYKGDYYSFPPNQMTIRQLQRNLGNSDPQTVKDVSYAGYNEKQWGRPLAEIPESYQAHPHSGYFR